MIKLIYIFLAVVIVTLIQVPVNFLARSGFITAGILLNEVVALAGVPFFFISKLKIDLRRILPFHLPSFGTIILVVLIAFGMVVVVDSLTIVSENIFPPPEWLKKAMDNLMSVSGPGDFVYKLILLCALPALCEEIFFRGFCQTSIKEKLGAWPAIIIVSLLFSAMHFNPWHAPLYFLISLVLGVVYEKTGTLSMPILVHFINNAWTFVGHQF